MNERKRVTVDETALQQMIARDESYLTDKVTEPIEKHDDSETAQGLSSEQYEQPKEENPLPDNDSGKVQRKRKARKSDFSELFLKERTVKNRKPIYISVETHDRIKRYLKNIGDVSFIAYVDNILLQHIEEHKDTIIELYNEKISNPF